MSSSELSASVSLTNFRFVRFGLLRHFWGGSLQSRIFPKAATSWWMHMQEDLKIENRKLNLKPPHSSAYVRCRSKNVHLWHPYPLNREFRFLTCSLVFKLRIGQLHMKHEKNWISIIFRVPRATYDPPTTPPHFGAKWAKLGIPQKLGDQNGSLDGRCFLVYQHCII